jgi:hypothetical protein
MNSSWLEVLLAGVPLLLVLGLAGFMRRSGSSRGPSRPEAPRPVRQDAALHDPTRPDEPDAATRLSGRPPPLATFAGRQHELEELRQRFQALRDTANGAIILAVHGMPGVGKSALAHELARGLAAHFPDATLFANLGNAGNIRAEADILNRFLMALGIPKTAIPTSTLERAALFRSATATKKVLVVLDAARDHQQVARLLPAAHECAVIVTSRRNLAPALGVQAFPLAVPDLDGALEMLRVATNSDPAEEYEFAVEIVERLGRLPLAIRAVADRVVQHLERLEQVAGRLRDRGQLERLLRNSGRGVEERIATEYARLTDDEQQAFRLLSHMESPSFVPWVLVPLLGDDSLDYPEAEKLISRLAERQLLEFAGRDEVTGVDRYRFHRLTRIFAEHLAGRTAPEPPLRRLDEAYLEVVDPVLARGDPWYRVEDAEAVPARWSPIDSGAFSAIDALPRRWVQAEHANLVRGVRAAHEAQRWGLCWRLASHVGECLPGQADHTDVFNALALGLDAAGRTDERAARNRAVAEVHLSHARILVHAQRYTPAFSEFRAATVVAGQLPPAPTSRRARADGDSRRNALILQCDVYRLLAAAHLRLGAFRDARAELDRSERLAVMADTAWHQVLIALMRAHTTTTELPAVAVEASSDEEIHFWYQSALAHGERRMGAFKAAYDRLRALRHHFEDDAAVACEMLTRMAELRLDELQRGDPPDRGRAELRALRRAAEALHCCQRIGDGIGMVQARCLLARALIMLGRQKDAVLQLRRADEEMTVVDLAARHPMSPLAAALRRAHGELLLDQDRREDGHTAMLEAGRLFRAHGDRAAEEGVLAALGLEALPDDVFDPGPPGRTADAWLEPEQARLRPGVPVQVAYTIRAPALVDGHFPAGGRYLNVMLVADRADVEPPTQTVRLDAWAPLPPVRFTVTPRLDGELRLRFLVYAADDGSFLQESEMRPRMIDERAFEDIVP